MKLDIVKPGSNIITRLKFRKTNRFIDRDSWLISSCTLPLHKALRKEDELIETERWDEASQGNRGEAQQCNGVV